MVFTQFTPTPRTAFSIEFCVLRLGCVWNEEGMSWPPVAAE